MIQKDPFRLFFPIGSILAIIGILPWTFHRFGTTVYPVEYHKTIMMNGFMFSFVAGFLMTAIPRFTGSDFAKPLEICFVVAMILSGVVAVLFGYPTYNYLFSAMSLAGLIAFAGVRFAKRTSNPPFTFVFVGLGLVLWSLSNLFLFLDPVAPTAQTIWRDVFSNGALMALVLGVGGRLIPAIFGWREVVVIQRHKYEEADTFLSAVPPSIWFLALVYILSFFLLTTLPVVVCLMMRALVTLVFAIRYWRLHRLPPDRTYMTIGLWLSCWCFVIGSVLNVMWLGSYTHSLHVILVGGFSLLTVLIATRVTLAHGSTGVESEKRSRVIAIFTFLLLAATLTRVTAPLWPDSYLNHLSYASFTWILGFILWTAFAIPKMTKP